MAAWETNVSGLQETSTMRGARETNLSDPQMMSMMKRVQETNAQEESAASRRRAGPQVNINVGDQSASQSRAVHCENPSAILERQRPSTH